MTRNGAPSGGIGPVENHRQREDGVIVYPVFSRRSKGLSIGINLFTQKKCCTFDCPYCEVFDFDHDIEFTVAKMEDRLRETICTAKAQNIIVKDICFSGNGEPTISPDFPAALRAAAMLRDADAPDAQIVIITNGTGLLHKETFNVLKTANAGYKNVMPWIKLDAGTEDWYKKIDVSNIPYADLIEAIQMYADGSPSPFIIQTMHCAVNNEEPSLHELAAWTERVVKLSGAGNVVAAHIYGKARPSPGDPVCSALPLASLQNRARLLESALAAAGLAAIPVEVFE